MSFRIDHFHHSRIVCEAGEFYSDRFVVQFGSFRMFILKMHFQSLCECVCADGGMISDPK